MAPTFDPDARKRIYLSYGGGVDSTAIAIEFVHRARNDPRYRIFAVIFADTGGERPETYAYVRMFSAWLVSQGYPPIVWVRKDGLDAVPELVGPFHAKPAGLEAKCLRLETLPSPAFGWRTCTDNFKIQPFGKFARIQQEALGETLADIVTLIGFEAGETTRLERAFGTTALYLRAYPLADWGWTRQDCIRRIEREGLAVPVKSACFFCPYTKRHEVGELIERHPALAARAGMIETGATKATKIAGLGRTWRWVDLIVAQTGLQAHETEMTQI